MAARCRNCDVDLSNTDRYCSACGQAVLEASDRSFAHLLRSSLAELTSVDSRLWRSLRLLLFRPGYLSLEYRMGRRRRYLSPIGLFVLGNLLFFLAPPLSDFQLSLADQVELQPYRSWIVPWVDDHLAASALAFEELAGRYQLRVVELAKLMVIVHVPLLALATLLLAVDKRLFYADHVVMGLHYFSFVMIYLIVLSAIFSAVWIVLPVEWRQAPAYLTQFVIAVHCVYVPVMLRTALGFSWRRAFLSTPVFIGALIVAHFVYRLVQFVVAFGIVTANA